jgi:hypothetical protein
LLHAAASGGSSCARATRHFRAIVRRRSYLLRSVRIDGLVLPLHAFSVHVFVPLGKSVRDTVACAAAVAQPPNSLGLNSLIVRHGVHKLLNGYTT